MEEHASLVCDTNAIEQLPEFLEDAGISWKEFQAFDKYDSILT